MNGLTRESPKYYRGASLAAMDKLARDKGYRLIGCDYIGVNAFWVRSDLCEDFVGTLPSVALRSQISRVYGKGAARDVTIDGVLQEIKEQNLELERV